MTAKSKDITRTFRQLRGFCEDVAKLMQTAEDLFTSDLDLALTGWNSAMHNSACWGHGASRSLKHPRGWIPVNFFRFFTHPGHRNLLAFVTFQVDTFTRDNTLDSALVCGGGLIYPPTVHAPAIKRKHFWFSVLHLRRPNRADDGTVLCAKQPFEGFPRYPKHVEQIISLGLPADKIESTSHLRNRIVAPLVQEICTHAEVPF